MRLLLTFGDKLPRVFDATHNTGELRIRGRTAANFTPQLRHSSRQRRNQVRHVLECALAMGHYENQSVKIEVFKLIACNLVVSMKYSKYE